MPFPTVPIKQQYRTLEAGEIIQQGDEWQHPNGEWRKRTNLGEPYKPEPEYGGTYHYPHRRPLTDTDWQSIYRAEVAEKDGWKESRQKLLAKLNEVTAQRDELREKYAMHHAEAERLTAENQSLNVQLSLARTMINGQERRHNEEVAKLNSNYLLAMDSTQIATLIRQAEKYENLKETIRIFVE